MSDFTLILNGQVAICMPMVDKPHALTMNCLHGMAWQHGKHGLPTTFVMSQGSLICNQRDNLLAGVEDLEKNGLKIEWLFFLDSDMVFPNSVLFQLLRHQKDIVGCTYVRRTEPYDVLGKTLEMVPTDISKAKLLEVAMLPTGCLLVRRDIFRKFKKPYWRILHDEEKGITYGEDFFFCMRVRELGYKIWLDVELSKSIGHIGERVLYPEQDSFPKAVNG